MLAPFPAPSRLDLWARPAKIGSAVSVVGGIPLNVHTYEPTSCEIQGVLVLLAGFERNAAGYRWRAIGLAERGCLAVIAPEFDEQRFPRALYQRAGVGRNGEDVSEFGCMGSLLSQLADWGLEHFGIPDKNYYLFGHSAGGQLLSRVAAYCPPRGVRRIVIANPSSHVFASEDMPPPYGFRGMEEGRLLKARLRKYLGQPVTLYVGSDDTGDYRLSKSRWAMRQGANRLQRAHHAYQNAKSLAEEHGWPFRWKLVEAKDVGHSSSDMLKAPAALEALFPNDGAMRPK